MELSIHAQSQHHAILHLQRLEYKVYANRTVRSYSCMHVNINIGVAYMYMYVHVYKHLTCLQQIAATYRSDRW